MRVRRYLLLSCLLYCASSYSSIALTTSGLNSVSKNVKCSKQGDGSDPTDDLSFQLSGSSLNWPCESTKEIYEQSGLYEPRNVIITRAQIKHNTAFVAIPRYKKGAPISLGKVNLRKGKCLATVEPFPCWAMQEQGNCEGFQSVVDLALDKQGLLWVLDVGLVNILEEPVRHCPAKLVAINTSSGKVVRKVDLSDLMVKESRLQYLVVDYSKNNKPYIYIADAGAGAIFVYDVKSDQSYRVVLPKIITPTKDVLYMSLVTSASGDSLLYFTYLSSTNLYYIRNKYLQVGEVAGSIVDVGPKPNGKHIVLLGSSGSTLYMRYKGENDIYSYDTETCFKPANLKEVLSGDECRLSTQVIPGVKPFMWSLSSNFQHYIAGNIGCNGPSIELRPFMDSALN